MAWARSDVQSHVQFGVRLTLIKHVARVPKIHCDFVHLPGLDEGGLRGPKCVGGIRPEPPAHSNNAVLDQVGGPVYPIQEDRC